MDLVRKYADPELGDIIFRKRKGIRRVSIRVHPVKGISVSVPYLVPFAAAIAFFKLKRDWAFQTVRKQKEHYGDIQQAGPEQIESLRRQSKDELPSRLAELASRYSFIYNKVYIKHNSTNWGSCSARGNINLNLNIVRLPRIVQDYILLHELCHLRHHDHGPDFHQLLEHVCSDNVTKACGQGDALARSIASAAASSKAKYPYSSLFSKTIRQYPLI